MTREEAYIWNENSHDENYSTVKEMEESIHYLLKRIYDSFENRSCKNCKYANLDSTRYLPVHKCLMGCNKVNYDFSCSEWKQK